MGFVLKIQNPNAITFYVLSGMCVAGNRFPRCPNAGGTAVRFTHNQYIKSDRFTLSAFQDLCPFERKASKQQELIASWRILAS